MKILGVIPARYDSSRFPGKPLVMIDGKSMIQRVYEQSVKCTGLSNVIVATDSEVIEKHVKSFGGKVMMTSSKHRSGTERCGEVIEKVSAVFHERHDVVINIQGDEPLIDPRQIMQVAEIFNDLSVEIATLAKRLDDPEELKSPNVVKLVMDKDHKAIYFSRQPIPFLRGGEKKNWLEAGQYYKHIGIYGYRSDILPKIIHLPPSWLESAESLEQLRWIENGFRIAVKETLFESIAIDVPGDLLKITNIR